MRLPASGKACFVLESFDKSAHKDSEDEQSAESSEQTTGFAQGHVTTLQNSYPVKLLVPSHASANSSVWVYPLTFGGGLVGGDSIKMNFHVKRNCCAVITGQESTKVYHCEDSKVSRQLTRGRVEGGGLLCVLADPVVCYKQASFVQTQEFDMSVDGNLVYLDWLIGGRVALDELWSLDSYVNKTDIRVNNKLVYRDNYHLQHQNHVSVLQAMSHYQVIGSCILIGNLLKPAMTNLYRTLGRKKQIGETHSMEVTCSVSQKKYTVEGVSVPSLYIRFMAISSSTAYKSVISYIIGELETMIGGNPFSDKY